MSAWKKPSRSAWRRKDCTTDAAMRLGIVPGAQISASRSRRRVPSTHSVTSTSRPVSSQFTAGSAEIRLARDVLRHLRIGGRLEPEVHLQRYAPLQDFHYRDRAQPARLRRVPLDEAAHRRRRFEGRGRSAHGCRAGAPSLPPSHAHRGGAESPCAPARSRRRPRNRRSFRTRNRAAGRSIPRRLLRASSVGNGRQVVLQAAERIGHVRADDVGARREELAELDVGRSEPVERIRDAPAALGRREPARLQFTRQTEEGPAHAAADRRARNSRRSRRGPAPSRRAPAEKDRAPCPLELPAGMSAAMPPEKFLTLDAGEPGGAHHVGEALLVGEVCGSTRPGSDRLRRRRPRRARAPGSRGRSRARRVGRASACRPRRIPGRGSGRRASATRVPPQAPPRSAARCGCRRRSCRRRSSRPSKGSASAFASRKEMPARPRRFARSRPTSSIAGLMSATTISAWPRERSATRNAMSPVPPATSSSRQGRPLRGGLSAVTSASFHSRCRPPDIRSFIRS